MSLATTVGPEEGGAVMAIGILSVAMQLVGREMLSLALMVVAAVGWALLGGLFFGRLCSGSARWRREAERPSSLTAVAATGVLGARLTLLGWSWAGWMMLVIASLLWVLLLWRLARIRPLPSTGAAFLVVVAPQSLVVLAALLVERHALRWVMPAVLCPFVFGLVAYVVVFARFDFAQLRSGGGDQWVSGGALAISTLACAQLARAGSASHIAGDIHQPLFVASLLLWGLSMCWLPGLIAAEARWLRPGYDARRWATVFPLGMYSVMSFGVGALAHSQAILGFARLWAWVALAVGAATTLGLVRHGGRTAGLAGKHRADPPRR